MWAVDFPIWVDILLTGSEGFVSVGLEILVFESGLIPSSQIVVCRKPSRTQATMLDWGCSTIGPDRFWRDVPTTQEWTVAASAFTQKSIHGRPSGLCLHALSWLTVP